MMVWVVLSSDSLANGPDGLVRHFAAEREAKAYVRDELQRSNRSVMVWEEGEGEQAVEMRPSELRDWAHAPD